MLTSLTIHNYALISDLEIEFLNDFSVLTGETGAGKSIILGALSLILGQRADAKSIKQNEDRCWIEGVFDISNYELQSFFEERELEYDSRQCILRRELWSTGKSRAFINDTPVGLNDLKELSAHLIDVHSQHQNLLLGEDRFQLQVLDVLSGNKELKLQYEGAFKRLVSLQKQFKNLQNEANESRSEEDYLRFQYQQLADAKLQPEEQPALETELEVLSNIEEIKGGLFRIEQFLSGDEQGIIQNLKDSIQISQSLQKVYTETAEFSERLQSVYLEIKDLAQEISSKQDHLELNPQRLQWVNERLDVLYSLQQKHKVNTTEELIILLEEIEQKLQKIQNYDDQLISLQNEMDASNQKVISLAEKLTQSRKKSGGILEKQLVEKVSGLGLPHIRFVCKITSKSQPDVSGMDDVSFLFSANKNVDLKPVSETASGGEISRIMLGIKALIAGAKALPTIIFDEIDTGVSGEVADKMASIMQELGQIMQVITITHLPQIASKGAHHYFVYKDENKHTTETNIRKLSPDERIREIAQMLSGSSLTDAALENAKTLLSNGSK